MAVLHSPEQIPELAERSLITWEHDDEHLCDMCSINGVKVAWMQARPFYCDRGHWVVDCLLPGLDGADMFPRYYMRRETAVAETEAFLRWRLWKIY